MENNDLQKIVRSVVTEIVKELSDRNIVNNSVSMPENPIQVEGSTADLYELNLPKRGRPVVTEADIKAANKAGKDIGVPANAIITPLAYELAQQTGIKIIITNTEQSKVKLVRIAIGSDHGGFKLKEALKEYMFTVNIPYIDVGTDTEKACDYPDLALKVAQAVVSGKADFGVMIDGAGIGSTMCANKLKGARAACVHNKFTTLNSRKHNQANIMVLGSNVVTPAEAKELLRLFITTDYEGGRHQKRIDKMMAIENI